MITKSAVSAFALDAGAAAEGTALLDRMIDGVASPAGVILSVLVALAVLSLGVSALTARSETRAAPPRPAQDAAPRANARPLPQATLDQAA